jgi:superfamily II DNA or RNA helicase
MGIPPLRTWQRDAIITLNQLWESSVSELALIAVCPGGGKTLFACLIVRDYLADKKVDLGIVMVPSINIQAQWVELLDDLGIRATDEASNAAMRWRQKAGQKETEDKQVIVITYQQLAKDSDLFVRIAEKCRVLLIGDEIHHADDAAEFGKAVEALADVSKYRLALSGTPFNSSGGALAMCPWEIGLDEEGRQVRKTKPLLSFSLGQAIAEANPHCCRPVEFVKVDGYGEATYRSLTNGTTYNKLVDLARQLKTDRIGVLLDPAGSYMGHLIRHSLKALKDVQTDDPRAGMLVVAKDTTHGGMLARRIDEIAREEGLSLSIQEIYNDTPKAHAWIKDLAKDRTDIIVSVRMISEGVDIKRLRVGLYATDYLTRMFFAQFVGRFARWEDRLDDTQHARIIIPAHITLLEFAREIELMIDSALMPEEDSTQKGGGTGGTSEFLFGTSDARESGIIFRDEESDERHLAEAFYLQAPSLRGVISEMQAIKAAKDLNLHGSSHQTAKEKKKDWSALNDAVHRQIVRRLKMNGDSDDKAYAIINMQANRAVGILKKDKLTPEDVLIKRHAWLVAKLRQVIQDHGEANFDLFA